MEHIDALSNILRRLKFTRNGRTWRRRFEEVIQVINLQKSGERNFVNIGLYLRGLGDLDSPQERLCHLRLRLESLCEVEPPISHNSLEKQQSDTLDQAEPNWEKMGMYLTEYLSTMVSERSIVDAMRSGRYKIYAVTLEARGYLGL